jgi:hypothetical protein
MLMSGRPDNIVVGEVEGRALVKSLASGAETATLGHGDIKHDLNITGPVSRVGKNEDGIDDDVGEVTLTRVGMLFGSELAERGGGRVVLNNVARGNNVLETIALGNVTALLTLTTDDENGAVLLSHLAHRSVSADELTRLDVALKLSGEVAAAFLFGLAATVGQENVRATSVVSNRLQISKDEDGIRVQSLTW